MRLWCLIREHQTYVGMSASCSLDDPLQFNEAGCRTMEDSSLMTDEEENLEPMEGACSMAVPAMSTRPSTSAL